MSLAKGREENQYIIYRCSVCVSHMQGWSDANSDANRQSQVGEMDHFKVSHPGTWKGMAKGRKVESLWKIFSFW